VPPVELTDGRGGGGGAKPYDGEKALSSINHERDAKKVYITFSSCNYLILRLIINILLCYVIDAD
jgi:hypothetical protein